MSENITNWDNVLNDLVSLYRDIERRSLSLSIFSLTPMFILLWNLIKFELCLILDIFLLIPMNLVIFLRNIFPGRWRYRSFSWSYIKYGANWIWRGELPTAPFAVIQPLVGMMISIHAHNRFRIIQKYLQLDAQVNDEQRERLNTKLTRILENYKSPNILSYFYTFVLPISGPMIEGYKWFFPGQTPFWLSMTGIFLVQYTIFFVRGVAIFEDRFPLLPAWKSSKIPRQIKLLRKPQPSWSLVRHPTRGWLTCSPMTRRDFVKPAFSLRYAS